MVVEYMYRVGSIVVYNVCLMACTKDNKQQFKKKKKPLNMFT